MNIKHLASTLVIAASVLAAGAADKAPDVTLNDVWTAYDSFNNVYLDTNKYIYKNTDRDRAAEGRDRGAAAIWCQPMFVDMAINATALARESGDKKRAKKYSDLTTRLIDGNIAHYLNFDFDNCVVDHHHGPRLPRHRQ